MDWVSNHFWQLFGGVGGTALVALIIFWLERRRHNPTEGLAFRDTTSNAVTVRDSQLTGSPVASGSQITQHNYFTPAPTTSVPVAPAPVATAPTVYVRPRPNIKQTNLRVFSVN